MKKHQSGLVLLILLFMLILIPSAFMENEEEDYPYTASSKEYDLSYDDIISLYRLEFLSLKDDPDHVAHRLFNDLIWMDEYAGDLDGIKAEIGYALKDLNGDGVEELLIGKNPAVINDVYTIRNEKTKELIRAGYRYDCHLLNDDTLYRTGSSGAAFYSSELYRMDENGEIVFVKGYAQDGEYAYQHGMGDEEEAWFAMPDSNTYYGNEMPDRLVDTNEAREWIENCESRFSDIQFTLLFEKSDTEFTGVVSVHGKRMGNDKVRIRKTPDKKGKILASIKVGTRLTVIGEENGYYKVKLSDGEGFIQKEFLLPEDEAEQEGSEKPEKEETAPVETVKETQPTTELPKTEPMAEAPSEPETDTQTNEPEKQPEYETVIDHYETVEEQRSRQVIDHYETYYTYADNGDGTFSETPNERPVYTTEYYTETVEKPVYKQVLKE